MGQEMSRRHSSDTLSLFPPLSDSITSITNDYRLDDIINNNYQDKKLFKKCRKLSKIRKSFSECFRSNFTRLQEIEDDDNNNEIMNSPRPNSVQSNIVITEGRSRRLNDVFFDEDLPRDIHEIHDQLTSLMQLLNRSDPETCQSQKRDVASQTTNDVTDVEQLVRQRDSIISEQEGKLKNLLLELDKKDRTIERYTRDLAAMKTQQIRHRLENRHVSQIVTLLRDVKGKGSLDSADLSKMDDVIGQLTSIAQPNKVQMDKSNVAVINPCANVKSEPSLFIPVQTLNSNIIQPGQQFSNPFLNVSENTKIQPEVKLICFLDHSVTPYISAIPLPSSSITLSHVKYYTKSVIPNNDQCKYIFKSVNSDCGPLQVEVAHDSDIVPVHDNKIIVRIRM